MKSRLHGFYCLVKWDTRIEFSSLSSGDSSQRRLVSGLNQLICRVSPNGRCDLSCPQVSCKYVFKLNPTGYVNNIPTMQFKTRITRSTQPKAYNMMYCTLWDTPYQALSNLSWKSKGISRWVPILTELVTFWLQSLKSPLYYYQLESLKNVTFLLFFSQREENLH